MDDRNDPETKLRDGIALLDAKLDAVTRYARNTGSAPINPIMLVVCESIDQAKDVEDLLDSDAFFGGRYRGSVLRIDSETPDASLAALETVEEPDSPVRIIVSVQMLKEGWDVANVYVIASLRPSISEILTEQTLGRGLRLPWGRYTDVELLDTLEVLAHERYEDLLVRARTLKEELIDWRTVARPDQPQLPQRPPVQPPLVATLPGTGEAVAGGVETRPPTGAAEPAVLTLVQTDARVEHTRQAARQVAELHPLPSCGSLALPILEMEPAAVEFSLLDIVGPDLDGFRAFGRQLRLSPEDVLRRSLLSARAVVGRDGITRVQLDTRPAADIVHSQGVLLAPGQARAELVRLLVLAPEVPNRASELRAAEPVVDAFLDGLGDAVENLGAWLDRAAGGLIDLVARAARKKAERPVMRDVLRLQPFAPVRTSRAEQSTDRLGEFRRNVGYVGWAKSMHAEVWFDSRPERTFANAVDTSELVRCWVRLLRGDLPILWNGMGSWYHPDFVVVEHSTVGEEAELHWLVEIKADHELSAFDVEAKREAAERWAARVSADPVTGAPWRYLLLSETAVADAKGDWRALRTRYAGR
jgi:type III restriction enzyme